MPEQTGYEIQTDGMKFAAPSRILSRVMNTEALLGIAKSSRAFDPTVFDETPPFFFPCEMSNRNLDSYYTRMDDSSLQNFAEDAKAGIAFQDSHNSYAMGPGRSLTGAFEQVADGARTVADFLVLPGIRFGSGSYASSDDFIRHVRAGIATDTSVGFYFQNTDPNVFAGCRCDICGENLYRWDCPHIPGMTYEITSEAGVITRVVCTGKIINAHASEESIVYDGATPGAAILKAQAEAALGRLQPKDARFLEDRYRSFGLKLPEAKQVFALGTVRGIEMEPEKKTEPETPGTRVEPVVARHPDDVSFQLSIRTLLTKAGYAETQEITVAITAMTDELVTLRASVAEIPALRLKAADGDTYRKDTIESAIAEGVRAHGAEWKAEEYRKMLEGLPLDSIKRMKDDWAAMGDKLFPGGRATVSEPAGEESKTVRHDVPRNAYV